MASFTVASAEEFDERLALVALLDLLVELIGEIWEDRELLLPPLPLFADGQPAAFAIARDQIALLSQLVMTVEQPLEVWDDYGLRGEALRFKLLIVAFANARIAPARNQALGAVTDGERPGRLAFYRRAVQGTLAAIDGPLESLTKFIGVKEGVVEFKKGLEVLLGLVS
ncbi:hypothetical protein ASE17_04880 [Phenylobacterium sp. Root77]|uniref:hypothetical protein n=1 Tax=unclassified Phenylobacterium TaxID=2640670 RepID=UPI0006FC66F0|nr:MULTISPECIES: hypothetical protein [unclassified Phenylobacterium]KQW72203.1 hypothetical protein ASC73_09105 [Phenylobacterium sp. Root1277]KQW95123.1 hypothetical protein ASC79_05250 [Phenylobacterium sp. Root1290]KRC44816.1 hypothetical protein ASE17_04880 [Phenylobacterium sp. Root77]